MMFSCRPYEVIRGGKLNSNRMGPFCKAPLMIFGDLSLGQNPAADVGFAATKTGQWSCPFGHLERLKPV
jgi:hypothetical protein